MCTRRDEQRRARVLDSLRSAGDRGLHYTQVARRAHISPKEAIECLVHLEEACLAVEVWDFDSQVHWYDSACAPIRGRGMAPGTMSTLHDEWDTIQDAPPAGQTPERTP